MESGIEKYPLKKYFSLLKYQNKDDVTLKKMTNQQHKNCEKYNHECRISNKKIRRTISFGINDEEEALCDNHPVEFDFCISQNSQFIGGCGYIMQKV